MTVRIAAAAALFLYFCMTPVYIVLFVRMRDSLRIGAGISLWIARPALRAAERRAADEAVRGAQRKRISPPKKAGGFHLNAIPAAWKLYRTLAKHIRVETISVTGSVCAGDAARTAMLCGLANAVRASLAAGGAEALRLNLAPDFSAASGDIRAVGMISIRVGHIMRAPFSHFKELKDLWKSTRSKA